MRRRTIKKNFWLNYEEDQQLKKLSEILNLSEASTIRKLLYETNVKECPPKEFYEAIEKINKIGVNINQIAKIANTNGYINMDFLYANLNNVKKIIEELRCEFL